jgi:hypothetical protein
VRRIFQCYGSRNKQACGGIEVKKELRFDEDVLIERQKYFVERFVSRTAGSGAPLTALVFHQIRRFAEGQQPESDIEKQVFAILQRVPKNVWQDYLHDWDDLPSATKNQLFGPHAPKLDVKKPLTAAEADTHVKGAVQLVKIQARQRVRVATQVVKEVLIKELQCVEDTKPELGKDEIFAIYLVATAGIAFQKQTGILKMKKNKKKDFAEADQLVFPPPNNLALVADQDIVITAALFESDEKEIQVFKNVLKAICDVAVAIVMVVLLAKSEDKKKFLAVIVPAIFAVNFMIDAATAGLKNTKPLGLDTIIVTPDGGAFEDLDGNFKNTFSFSSTARKGPGPFEYRINKISRTTRVA